MRMTGIRLGTWTALILLNAGPGWAVTESAQKTHSTLEHIKLSGIVAASYDYAEFPSTPPHGFTIPRARLKLDADLRAGLGVTLSSEYSSSDSELVLLDALLRYRFLFSHLELRAGQFRTAWLGDGSPNLWAFISPLNRGQTLAWDGRGRGLALRVHIFDKRLFFETHVLNDNGIEPESRGQNENQAYRTGALLKWEPLGAMGPHQNDLTHSNFAFGIKLSTARSFDHFTEQDRPDRRWLGAAAYLKNAGWYAKILWAHLRQDEKQDKIATQDLWSAQMGYSIKLTNTQHIEPVFRWSFLRQKPEYLNEQERWYTLGFNYFIHNQQARLQVNYTFKDEESAISNDVFELALVLLI